MITSNVDALAAQLEDLHKETIRKLERMVEEFVDAVGSDAVDNTPLGDLNKVTKNGVPHSVLYKARLRAYGWPAEPGLAKGNWYADSGESTYFSFDRNAIDPTGSISKSRMSELPSYKLGQTVWIVNTTPYVYKDGVMSGRSLESGYSNQASDGIIEPTLDYIMNVYQYKFDTVYKRV